jgi:hypothetical protein
LKKIATNPLTLISCFIISALETIALSSIAFFTLKFFGLSIPGETFMSEWVQVVLICLILYNAISFIPTPGNSGAADLSFYALFQKNLMVGLAFPAMVSWRILSFYAFIVVGFIYNAIDKKLTAKKAESNMREAAARGAEIITFCTSATEDKCQSAAKSNKIVLPEANTLLYPFMVATAVQLLAYHTSNLRGLDVDKPRNLAKSVTVE